MVEPMSMTELIELYMSIMGMREIKGARFEFGFLIREIRKVIKPVFEDAQERVKILQDEVDELRVKYCLKDKYDKPILIKNSDGTERYQGLTLGLNPDFDNRMKEISKEIEAINKNPVEETVINRLNDIKTVSKDVCPKSDILVKHWEALYDYLDK